MAKTKVDSAREEVKKHANRIEIAKKAVTIAETKKHLQADTTTTWSEERPQDFLQGAELP